MANQPQKTDNPIEASTHWQNEKFEPIATDLTELDENPDVKLRNTNVQEFLYNGHKIKAKFSHCLHFTTDEDDFLVHVGLN